MPDFDDELARPRELLRPCLLLLLAEGPGHGYDLMVRLKQFGFDWGGPGPIYRELRALEETGAVRSRWEAPGAGPARHVYEISDGGAATLQRWASDLQGLTRLLDEYDQRFRAVASGAPEADPPPVAPGGADRGDGRKRIRRR